MRLQGLSIVVNRAQRIGYFAEGLEHRLLINASRLLIRRDCFALFGPQRPAVEDGLCQRRANTPDITTTGKLVPMGPALGEITSPMSTRLCTVVVG